MGDGSKFEWVSPALASFPWINDFQQTLSSVDARLSLVTQHYYAGEYLSSQPVASDFLLEDRNATDGPAKLTGYIVASHSAGKKFRIGEMNSLSNGGQPGVSDSFSAALWGLDIMFEFAKAGADGVNWHTGNGGAYGLFDFDLRKDSASGLNIYSLGEVRPLFYALQLFEEATESDGRLLPVSVTTTANVKVWALKGVDGLVRVVVLNKDEAQSGSVEIRIPGFASASASQLLAPSLGSKTGVTIAGQTYNGSLDGTLQGPITVQSLKAVNGVFTIIVPSVSAALVTLAP